MKIVLDTNVLVSGIFWSGVPSEIVQSWIQREFQLLATQNILEEYCRIIGKIALDDKVTQHWEIFITENISLIKDISITTVCRDPKDNMFLNCALAGKADFIISGDDDLLALKKISGIEIVKPVHFLNKIRKSR